MLLDPLSVRKDHKPLYIIISETLLYHDEGVGVKLGFPFGYLVENNVENAVAHALASLLAKQSPGRKVNPFRAWIELFECGKSVMEVWSFSVPPVNRFPVEHCSRKNLTLRQCQE
uniref:Uncharacterized protein n=1 Tax=Vespula pensylvanica TaxID=30213 RepID=A0A834P6R7_VESPE|nr:hypothetical protein H0235_006397 [Vespula pensylvanica]